MRNKRILLVDDERNVRSHIRMMLRYASYDVVEAGNGTEAIELLGRHAFDLLITDIRMPQMDGIALIRQALIDHPRLPSVVLSNYAEFQLAQQAIRYGAKEYLLKATLTKEELVAIIDQLVTDDGGGDGSAKPREALDRNEMMTIMHALFHERLHNRISTPELARRANKHGLPLFMEDGGFQFAFVQVDRFASWLQDKYQGQVELAVFSVQNMVSEWYRTNGRAQEIFHLSEGRFLVAGPAEEDVDHQRDFEQLKSLIERYFHVGISVICGYAADSLEELFQRIHDHMPDYDHLFYCPYGTICHASEARANQGPEEVDVHHYFMELLRNKEDVIKVEQLPIWIDSFLEVLVKVRRKPEYVKQDLLLLITFIERNGYSVDQAFQQEIQRLQASHYVDYKSLFRSWLQANRVYGSCYPEITKALQYIQEHYMEKMTLDDVSAAANLSRSHFSKVFKEEVGMTLVAYIEMVRMNQARMLLKTTKFSIGEICEMIGIPDIFYFSKMYKKRYKVSPSKDR